jgi:lipopolysaccharide/colanic/teichoic acid biosynthesis glycosyltransferase/GGDEF domain-containing protein
MIRLRFAIILLAVWLIVLFNIEREDALNINLPTILYIASAVVVVITLFVPDFVLMRWYLVLLPFVSVYSLIRYVALIDGTIPPVLLIITESMILSVAFFIGWWLSSLIGNIERTYDSLVLDTKSSRILSGQEGEDLFNRELFRARQYERPVSLLLLKTPTLKQLQRAYPGYLTYQVTLQHRYLKSRIAQLAETLLYTTDPIAWYGDDIVICLPETTSDRGFQLAQRIAAVIRVSLNLNVQIGIAELTKSTLLYQDLLKEAERNMHAFMASPDTDYVIDDDDDDISDYTIKNDTQPIPAMKIDLDPTLASAEKANGLSFFGKLQIRFQIFYERARFILTEGAQMLPPHELELMVPAGSKLYYNPEFWVNRLPYQSDNARRFYSYFKRAIDIILVLAASPLILLLSLFVALAIKLEDGGPVFYSQFRTGHGGHQFRIYKFRSMVPNADKRMKEMGVRVNERNETVDEHGNKLINDPRITRIGRFIRKVSLDELPQLWSVFKGDMSLVGPRPTTFGVEKYTLLHTQRLSVKPGLTGLWQVYDRGDTDFNNRLIWDIKYIEKMCFWLDVQLIFRTITEQVLKRRGQ